MCDKLVYDLAQEVEGAPSVFVRKDWINILDNQNQNYISNQSVLDTSQLSNSNKYMSYREAYFSIPFIVSMGTQTGIATNASLPLSGTDGGLSGVGLSQPTNQISSIDNAVGLKNWFGNIIHSFTVDYNGSTIIQQTPFVNMWNSFKLMTSLSFQDILTQGPTIGFYPDDAEAFEFYSGLYGSTGLIGSSRLSQPTAPGTGLEYIPGTGACNNNNYITWGSAIPSAFSHLRAGHGNEGFWERQKTITFDVQGICGNTPAPVAGGTSTTTSASPYGFLLQGADISGNTALTSSTGTTALNTLWKSYIIKKQDQAGTVLVPTTPAVLQYAVVATVYLKHIHSFFNMIPLLKGVFMKMTMNLNNCSSTVYASVSVLAAGAGAGVVPTTRSLACSEVSSALGGVNMLMCASNAIAGFTGTAVLNGAGGANLTRITSLTAGAAGLAQITVPWRMNISVGGRCLDATLSNTPNVQLSESPLSKSIYLYIPAYTFNPAFEQAYISSPVKTIKFTDVYQYQVLNVPSGNNFNNLLTNGIANVKSVLILPFFAPGSGTASSYAPLAGVQLNSNTCFTQGLPVWQSPFDPAGTGPTSPMCHLSNFNIQVSGQNAIYNLQKYGFEQFNNQLYGQNAVNGGLTDGITSGLVSRQGFDLEYCYYYVNVERMLPVEQSVPKSIQVLGQNMSSRAIDLICFIEYGVEISIDVLTGARV